MLLGVESDDKGRDIDDLLSYTKVVASLAPKSSSSMGQNRNTGCASA